MLSSRRTLLLATGVAAATSMTGADAPRRPTAAPEVWARAELYFGTNKPNNEEVSDVELQAFIDNEVTPRFPDGLTLLNAYGQFRSSAGILIRENSYVLILFYPPQMPGANRRIQEVREVYKRMFLQESVLRVDSFSYVSF